MARLKTRKSQLNSLEAEVSVDTIQQFAQLVIILRHQEIKYGFCCVFFPPGE